MLKCHFEDGQQAALRHVTVDAIIVESGKTLFIKRSAKYHIEPGKLALPGGYLDRDESCDQAVIREVREETGYHSEAAELFAIIHSPRLKGDDRQNVGFFYIVNLVKLVGKPDDEVDSIHWQDFNKLDSSQVGFDHYDILQKYFQHLKSPQKLPVLDLNF